MYEFLFDPENIYVWVIIISVIAGVIAVISRPFASFIQFVYPNAKYEAIGNPYINRGTLEKLAESDNLDHFIDQVNSNKDYHIQGTDASEVQKHLDHHFTTMIDQMKKDHGKKMQAFFTTYIEFKHSWMIKEIVRALHNKTPIDAERLQKDSYSLVITQFINQINDASDEEIPTVLKSFGFSQEFIDEIGKEDVVPVQLDAGVDRFFLQQMEKGKVPYKCQEAKHEYLARLIDILSIKHLIRAKQMDYHEKLCNLFYIGEGYEVLSWKFDELCKAEDIKDLIELLNGTSYYFALKHAMDKQDITKSVQPLITAVDAALLSTLRQISQQYYVNIGPSLRHLISKEIEITNLKIISKGIAEHIATDHITPLLITEVES